jgi:hypothetical protein
VILNGRKEWGWKELTNVSCYVDCNIKHGLVLTFSFILSSWVSKIWKFLFDFKLLLKQKYMTDEISNTWNFYFKKFVNWLFLFLHIIRFWINSLHCIRILSNKISSSSWWLVSYTHWIIIRINCKAHFRSRSS